MKMKKTLCLGLAFLIIFNYIFFPNVEAIRYCEGNELHENITVNGGVVHLILDVCPYGCSETTLINLGLPGCIESDLLISIIFMIGLFVAVLIIKKVSE